MHLKPRNAERHHDVCDGVRLREKVGYLAAGLDIPVGYVHLPHLLLSIAGELTAFLDLALTHRLHRFKRKRRLHSLLNEVDHNVVTAADGLVDCRNAV